MKIKRFENYSDEYIQTMASDLMNNLINEDIKESNSSWVNLQKKVLEDLGINFKFVATFGTGITAFFPVIDNLIKNMNLKVDVTPEMIIYLTICAVAIIYLEENKEKSSQPEMIALTKDVKSELEEFRMKGLYGIVKKVVSCLKSTKYIFNIIAKHSGVIAYEFCNLFIYTALFVPIISIMSDLITNHKIDLDTLPGIFLGVGVSITTMIAKNFIVDFIKKLKAKFNIKKEVEEEIKDELGIDDEFPLSPIIQKYSEYAVDISEPIYDGEANKI